MKAAGIPRIEALLALSGGQVQKIENALNLISNLKRIDQIKEMGAIEIEAKELEKMILQIQKLKIGLTKKTPAIIRLLNDVEMMEDKEIDIQLKFGQMRKKVLGIEDAGGGGGGGSKGVLMAAALGMKIGEQGIKKTEEILATLKEANNLMDNMQGDILEQRKKLFRIKDQVKKGQSIANRGREALKYFSDQAGKDVCIKVLVGLIVVMILVMGVLTYQISKEQEAIEISPDEVAEENLAGMGLEIDENGRIKIDPELEANDGDGYFDKEPAKDDKTEGKSSDKTDGKSDTNETEPTDNSDGKDPPKESEKDDKTSSSSKEEITEPDSKENSDKEASESTKDILIRRKLQKRLLSSKGKTLEFKAP